MKVKKLISALCAAAMSVSAFAGLTVSAASGKSSGELIYTADFDKAGGRPIDINKIGSMEIVSEDDGKHLSFGGTWSRYRQPLEPYSVSIANDNVILYLDFDVRFDGNSMNGIGLTDSGDGTGAFWLLSYNNKGMVMGSNENSEGTKISYLTDESGNKPSVDTSKWYRVESSIEFPSKLMTTRVWERDAQAPVVYTASMIAPAYGSYAVGGVKDTVTTIHSIRYMSVSGMDIDNVSVTRADAPLYHADFDVTGDRPTDINKIGSTEIVSEDNDKHLSFGGTWSRYRQELGGSVSIANDNVILYLDFDVRFDGNDTNGIGLTDSGDGTGAFWLLSYNKKGMVIGSNENNEGTKISYLTDESGNTPSVDTSKWYRVESSIEFPSKLMTTRVWERDAQAPVVYTASMIAPAYGNYAVGGVKDTVTTINHIRYMSVSGMDIDNITVEKTLPPLKVSSVEFNGSSIEVAFNDAIADGSAITLNGEATEGALSADGKTYIIPASGLKTGTYTVTVPEGIASPDGKTVEETVEYLVNVVDSFTLGYHPFNDGLDNGSTLSTAGTGQNRAGIREENGNYYMYITKGTGGHGDWNYGSYLASGNTADNITKYWETEASSKLMSVEFDIRSCGIPTDLERIYISKMHQHNQGLEILGMGPSSVNMGEPEASRAFTGITNLEVGKWYHYTYILDINNKKATATLTDGVNTYTKDWTSLTGSGTGYWTDSVQTPFNTLAFQIPGGDLELDNITFKEYYEAPVVTADSIVFKNGDEIQSDWREISPITNTVVIDFGTAMDEAALNDESVYVTKAGDTQKLAATGEYADGRYVLTLTETLSQNTEYELHITTEAVNVLGESFAEEDYTAAFKTAAGYVAANLIDVTSGETAVSGFEAFKALAGQKVKINVSYVNTTEAANVYNVIVAHYSGNALVKAQIISVPKEADVTSANDAIEYTVPSDMSLITSARIFLWGDFNDIRPLSMPIEF